jgi:hypothetical protein
MGIRLVTLHPSRDRDSPLKCSLRIDSLDNSPDYEALSYTWGSGYGRDVIQIDRRWMGIRSNLSAALRELRLKRAGCVPRVMVRCSLHQHVRPSRTQLTSPSYEPNLQQCFAGYWCGLARKRP